MPLAIGNTACRFLPCLFNGDDVYFWPLVAIDLMILYHAQAALSLPRYHAGAQSRRVCFRRDTQALKPRDYRLPLARCRIVISL